MFLDRVIYFRGNLVDQVKGCSPKELKVLIEVPTEVHLKVHILSYNKIVHFGENLGEQVKGRPMRKLKSLIEVPYVTRLKVQVLRFNINLISSRQRFPRPSYPFRGKFGDQVKGHSPKKLKSLIEVPYIAHLNVQDLRFNMNLISSRKRVPRPSYSFRGKFGDQVKGHSPKKLELFIVVHYVEHMKIQVLSCNMNLISSPQQAPGPSYLFRGKFGRSGKGSFTQKARIAQRDSLCIASERTCSKLQYDPYLISVACSYTEISISRKIWEFRKRVVHRKS